MKARRPSSGSAGTARGSFPVPSWAASAPYAAAPDGSAWPAIRPRKPGLRSAASRSRTAPTACSATVRPKRAVHAPGIGSLLVMVPVAVASSIQAPDAFESVSVRVSGPSSCASPRTETGTVFDRSLASKVRVPDTAV